MAADTKSPPNVLLIMTDDQGWGDVRSHGNPLIHTPVMDALAASGARFDRFYVSPVCAPTRASLLTGRYHLRTGVHGVTRGHETMRSSEVTIAEVLKQAGYATACFGKWHNGAHYPQHPNGQGFDEFLGFCAGHWNNYFDTPLEHNGRPVKSEGFIIDTLTDAALQYIDEHRQQPFFCYVAYNTPHSPFQVPDRYFDKYKQQGLDDTLACVHGMCENIDDNLGRLLKQLDDLQIADNTIVVFLTDNGPNTVRYNGDMKGRKGSVDEGGVRVPLFVRWPGQIAPATTVSQIASHIDILPTLVELTGIDTPRTLPLDGVSLVPLLTGKQQDWPARLIYSHQFSGNQVLVNRGSVRSQQHRAVFVGRNWKLYDMQNDPGQQHNLAATHPEILRPLQQSYLDWFADVTIAGFEIVPTEIGHQQRPTVTLPGHEAYLSPKSGQGISYLGRNGWANDWVTNWTDTSAYPWWPLNVVEAGTYEITLLYVCPKTETGSRLRVEVGDQSIEGTVNVAHDPQPIRSPDRVKRSQASEKIWKPLILGTVMLPAGETRLAVKAVEIAHTHALDLKAVQIRRLD